MSSENPNVIHLAEVKRHGQAIVLPETMSTQNAIAVLTKVAEAEELKISKQRSYVCLPFDGSLVTEKAVKELFGYFITVPTETPWGKTAPQQISVQTGLNESTPVWWGSFVIPIGTDQVLGMTSADRDDRGTLKYTLNVRCKGKHAKVVDLLFDKIQELLPTVSLLKGKTFSVRFKDSDGDFIMPWPKFEFYASSPARPIFDNDVETVVDNYILTPLAYRDKLKASGVPFKRGILAGGPYGCGKTMLAAYMAHKAVESGGTFIYVPEAHEIVYALQLARQYQPAVVFCEDIDRVAAGLRTDSVNAIINTLDGVDTKDADIITMLTTNHVENINRAMLRPGRIDIGLSILPPGAEAVQRLIAHYLGTFADKSNDYTDVGKALAGRIPAVIREIVERSKLTFIGRTKMPVGPGCITDLDLMAAIHQYQNEEKLFVEQVVDYRSDVEKAADALGGHLKDIAKDRSAVLHAEDGHLVSASAKMMLDEEFDNSGF